jgi:hypothetical protein
MRWDEAGVRREAVRAKATIVRFIQGISDGGAESEPSWLAGPSRIILESLADAGHFGARSQALAGRSA